MPPAIRTLTNKSRPRVTRDRGGTTVRGADITSVAGGRLLSWLLAILFGLSAVAVLTWRGSPLPIAEGQRAERPYLVRQSFIYIDPMLKTVRESQARESVPNYYRESAQSLDNLMRQLKDLTEKHSSTEVGLFSWDASTSFDGKISKDEALNKFISEMEKEYYLDGLELLGQEFRKRGIVRPESYEMERYSRKIRIYTAGGRDRESSVSTLLVQGLDNKFTSVVKETFLEVPPEFQKLFAELLSAEAIPTLEYDQHETSRRKDEAAGNVVIHPRVYREAQELLAVGKVASPEAIELIRAEYAKYVKSITWRALLMRLGGLTLLVFSMTTLVIVYLNQFQPQILESRAETCKLAGLCLLALAVSKAIAHFGHLLPFSPYVIPIYMMPMPFFASVITIAYSPRIARVLAYFLAVLIAIMCGMNFSLLVVLVLGSFVAIFLSLHIRSRTVPFKIGLTAGAMQGFASMAFAFILSDNPFGHLYEATSGLANGIVMGVALSITLPLIERVFNIVTDSKLLELSDQNHPLLSRLALEAPGTYQHTLMVAMLAEAGAEAIGANSLLARVGCYYHDIGKMNKAHYFVENEDWRGSMHKDLNPSMSALIISSHVRDGLSLAEDYNLPRAMRAFILEHHGTTLIEFFYREAEKSSSDQPVEESHYRYPGPKPQTRETGISLLVDTVEAACRTLENPTASRIENLVHELSLKKLMDGQFNECGLTLDELKRVEESTIQRLTHFYHHRVKYPGQD